MISRAQLLPPSSSLPALRSVPSPTEKVLQAALRDLYSLYCPLPPTLAFKLPKSDAASSGASTPFVDSGYASEVEDDRHVAAATGCKDADALALVALRDDVYERSVAERWLASFIVQAEELLADSTEETREAAVDKASCILDSFFFAGNDDSREEEADEGFTREFSFELAASSACGGAPRTIDVRLNDGLAGQGEDHLDVGLQSWGASIVFSDLLCSAPADYGLSRAHLGSSPRVVELGAGTGLVGIVIAKIMHALAIPDPIVVATDYIPSVIDNLIANVAANGTTTTAAAAVQVCRLDWSDPQLDAPLDQPADILVATDVVYAPEHASWLLDCAARLLAPDGIFWLVVTVRKNGRFDGISETVESAFAETDRPRDDKRRKLGIIEARDIQKRGSVGRADESGYRMFRIGWA